MDGLRRRVIVKGLEEQAALWDGMDPHKTRNGGPEITKPRVDNKRQKTSEGQAIMAAAAATAAAVVVEDNGVLKIDGKRQVEIER